MTTKPKMKGIFKGFKYISQIFEEEKDDDIQIGFPTDVKHVAHIGWDGPQVDSPSWMKEFSGSPGLHSAPLGPPTGGEKGEPEIKWVSEDANTKRSNRSADVPDVPRSSRRNQSGEGNGEMSSPKKRDPTKVKQRRNHSKDSSEGSVRSTRDPSDPGVPDPARKSRRKSRRSRMEREDPPDHDRGPMLMVIHQSRTQISMPSQLTSKFVCSSTIIVCFCFLFLIHYFMFWP